MANALEQEMYTYFTRLNDTEKKSVIRMLKELIIRRDGMASGTVEEYSRELEQASREIAAGEYISHEEVLKRYLKE